MGIGKRTPEAYMRGLISYQHSTQQHFMSDQNSKGLCKVKKIPKIQKNLDRAQPTHPPPYPNFVVVGNSSVTRPEHSNHNGF